MDEPKDQKIEALLKLEKPLKNGLDNVDPKFKQYITDVPKEMLFELVESGGVYMNIEPLLHLAAAKIALDVRDLYISDIRRYFSCENDVPFFSEEEETKMKEENIWINEKEPIEIQIRGRRGSQVAPKEENINDLPLRGLGLLGTK